MRGGNMIDNYRQFELVMCANKGVPIEDVGELKDEERKYYESCLATIEKAKKMGYKGTICLDWQDTDF